MNLAEFLRPCLENILCTNITRDTVELTNFCKRRGKRSRFFSQHKGPYAKGRTARLLTSGHGSPKPGVI